MAKKIKSSSVSLDAHKAIHGVKHAAYGPVEESFRRIATIASIGIRKELTVQDIAMIMLSVKFVRESVNHSRDNLLDLCGYADLLQQLHEIGDAK